MIKVIVVDDSPLVRKIVTDILNEKADIEVIATAGSAEFAIPKIKKLKPDVVTMDIEMPGMNGIEAIEKIMADNPTPIIVLSAFAKKGAELTLQAIESGAVDFITKPTSTLSGGIDNVAKELVEKVRYAASVDIKKVNNHIKMQNSEVEGKSKLYRIGPKKGEYEIVAIGTSTGGPVALKTVLKGFPKNFPVGIVVVQHMPPVFTKAFADRLNSICQIEVREARDGDSIIPGVALIAPGDFHITVSKLQDNPHIMLHKWEPVSGHRPSVDVLMHSVAKEYGNKAIGVIMTGMGKDGAEGIHELKQKGGWIIAQDQETSVIFGMNKTVINNGDADEVLPVYEISKRIIDLVPIKEKKAV